MPIFQNWYVRKRSRYIIIQIIQGEREFQMSSYVPLGDIKSEFKLYDVLSIFRGKGEAQNFDFYLNKYQGLEDKLITDGWSDVQINEVYIWLIL